MSRIKENANSKPSKVKHPAINPCPVAKPGINQQNTHPIPAATNPNKPTNATARDAGFRMNISNFMISAAIFNKSPKNCDPNLCRHQPPQAV